MVSNKNSQKQHYSHVREDLKTTEKGPYGQLSKGDKAPATNGQLLKNLILLEHFAK